MVTFMASHFSLWTLLLVLAIPVSAQPCKKNLQGHLQLEGSGEPLAFASLWLHDADLRTTTDAAGDFSFTGLCEGRIYHLEISYLSQIHAVDISVSNTKLSLFFPNDKVLSEVTIAAKSAPHVHTESVCVVDALDFESKQAMSLGEMVRQVPGVNLLQTGANISKPIIQGLHSNRIAIVNNNMVLESQQWGREHAPEIDPFSADKITVVKGAMGVRYGAGAMAGAIVLDPAPLRETAGWGGWATVGGFSNGRSGVGASAVDYRTPGGKLAFRLQGAAKRGGNLRAPDYWLYNTGHAEYNGSFMGTWEQSQRLRHEVSFSRVDQKLAVLKSSHLGNLEQITAAIQLDTPLNNINRFSYQIGRPYQSIQHYTGKYRLTFRINDHWKLYTQYGYQFNQRREYDVVRKTGDAADKAQVSFRLWTNALDVHMEHRGYRYWQGEAGIQAIQSLNYVNRGAFIPNYLTLGGSAWAHERWRRHGVPWEWEIGARYDYRHSQVYTEGNASRDIDRTVQFGNISGVTGLHYHVSEDLSLTLHTGYAWRPPSVYELFAKGVHHGAGTYEEGDSSLVSEKGFNSSLTLNYAHPSIQGFVIVATLYRNQIRDFIYLDPLNTSRVTVRGAFPAYQYRQSNAVLQGADAQVSLPIRYGFSAEIRISLLRAFRTVADNDSTSTHRTDPLPLMPSDRYQYGLSWSKSHSGEHANSTTLRLMASSVLRQTRIPEAGLLSPPPAGFTTLTLDASRAFTITRMKNGKTTQHQWEIGLTVQNLTNQRYREYLNFFRYYADEPGMNAGIRIKLFF